MFGVGLMEIAVIGLVAIIALGPERLPEFARTAAQFIHKARGMATTARDELRSELGPEYADLQLRDLDPRNIVKKQISEALSDTMPSMAAEVADAAALFEPDTTPIPFDVEAT